MVGSLAGIQEFKIHVHNSSLPSTSSQENIESSLKIISAIQRATRLVVQIYHKLFSFKSKADFIEALHDRGSIHELRYVCDIIFATQSDVNITCQRLVI